MIQIGKEALIANEKCTAERDALLDVPNSLGYQRVFETSTNGYLVRQFFYSSLYDRMR